MADETEIPRNPTTLVDTRGRPHSADHPLAVNVTNVESPVELTGDVVVDTLGALDDAKVTDPDAASATIPALLRGLLAELKAQTALLTTIAANTEPAE